MSDFLSKLLLGFFTGLVFPILLEMWKARQLRLSMPNSASINFDEITNKAWDVTKAAFRVVLCGFAGLGATALVNVHILNHPRMPDSLVGYVMVVVFSIIIWLSLSKR